MSAWFSRRWLGLRVGVAAILAGAMSFGCHHRDAEQRALGDLVDLSGVKSTLALTGALQGDFRLQAVDFDAHSSTVWLSGTEGRFAVGQLDQHAGFETDWRLGLVGESSPEGPLQFRDVAALGAGAAVLLAAGSGSASRIYTTADQGATWIARWVGSDVGTQQPGTDEDQGRSVFLDCMDFWDDQRGLVFGDSIDEQLFILTTEDGGQSWSRLATAPAARNGEGGFAASGDCVQTGREGWAGIVTGATGSPRLVTTHDYGASWSSYDLPIVGGAAAGATAFAIDKSSPRSSPIFVVGGDLQDPDVAGRHVVVSRDQGSSWIRLGVLPMKGALYGIAVDGWSTPGEERVVVVGPSGVAFSNDGGGTFSHVTRQSHWSVAFRSTGRPRGSDEEAGYGLMVGPDAAASPFRVTDSELKLTGPDELIEPDGPSSVLGQFDKCLH